jgi:hypothetical protein
MKALFFPFLFFPCVGHATGTWFTGLQEIESTGEVLAASDILVESYRVDYSGVEGPWTFELGLGWNRYRIDYQPILFGTTERLDEGAWQGDLALTREWSKEWSSTLRFRAYEGFSDYRSLWTSEFYRQFSAPSAATASPIRTALPSALRRSGTTCPARARRSFRSRRGGTRSLPAGVSIPR